MELRVIFLLLKHFRGLDDFLGCLGRCLGASSGASDANFFLFGEDILWAARSKGPLPSHEQVLSFIPRLQRILHPNDFVVFSIYETIGPGICNSVYLIGRKEWHFDFKRSITGGDKGVVEGNERVMGGFLSGISSWWGMTRLNRRSPKCVRSPTACIRNIRLVICADVRLLPRMGLGAGSLVFVPASGLDKLDVAKAIAGIKAPGYAFVNDPWVGFVLAVPFGGSPDLSGLPSTRKGKRKDLMYIDFELK